MRGRIDADRAQVNWRNIAITLIGLISALRQLKKREHKIQTIAKNSGFNYPSARENFNFMTAR
jgi:hypothetical protein